MIYLSSIHKYLTLSFFMCVLTLSVHASSNKLDALFLDLKNAPNESEARKIETKIWKSWLVSGDAEIDELMTDALRDRRSYNFEGALETLNKIIKLKPDYSEVWNQRATVYFRQQKFEKSLEDIAKTLELEPRHFGSLAGRAVIRLQQNKSALARQNIVEAMKYHPFLKERDMFPRF